MRQHWYGNTTIYSLDVESFEDADGNGVGDFQGLTDRLDYLSGLGVGCVWLLPFYTSPNRDNGYDVADYYNVDPRLGSLGDRAVPAPGRGPRRPRPRGPRREPHLERAPVVPDGPSRPRLAIPRLLPVAPGPPERAEVHPAFPGAEESVWGYDDVAGAYYMHRFYRHQPDLNIAEPRVRDEILKIMGFWLRLGVSGFRVELAYSIVFSVPGTPVVRYGEEIGMGDDLSLPERRAVRTAMQWSSEPGAGFSTADPSDFARPLIDTGPFGYKEVNVASQRREPTSLLNQLERLIRTRNEAKMMSDADWRLLEGPSSDAVFALRYDQGDQAVMIANNLSDEARRVDVGHDLAYSIDLLGDHPYDEQEPVRDGRIDVSGHGYR